MLRIAIKRLKSVILTFEIKINLIIDLIKLKD